MSAPAVLIVDDEQPLARILSFAFQNEGCVVDVATDGIDCLARIGRSRPEIVLMDIMMPRLDGLETIRLLRQNRAHRDLVIVAMSARGGHEVQARALAAGADLFIAKPFEIGQTIASIIGLMPATRARED